MPVTSSLPGSLAALAMSTTRTLTTVSPLTQPNANAGPVPRTRGPSRTSTMATIGIGLSATVAAAGKSSPMAGRARRHVCRGALALCGLPGDRGRRAGHRPASWEKGGRPLPAAGCPGTARSPSCRRPASSPTVCGRRWRAELLIALAIRRGAEVVPDTEPDHETDPEARHGDDAVTPDAYGRNRGIPRQTSRSRRSHAASAGRAAPSSRSPTSSASPSRAPPSGSATSSSPPRRSRSLCAWLRRFFAIDEARLRVRMYLHEGLDLDAAHAFWSEITGIPVAGLRAPYPVPRYICYDSLEPTRPRVCLRAVQLFDDPPPDHGARAGAAKLWCHSGVAQLAERSTVNQDLSWVRAPPPELLRRLDHRRDAYPRKNPTSGSARSRPYPASARRAEDLAHEPAREAAACRLAA